MIRREGCKSLAMLEEINGCPHQEGIDYPEGTSCPKCQFWAGKERPIERGRPEAGVVTGIATYKPEQWEAFLASATDRDALEDTWEKWNAGLHKLTAELDDVLCQPRIGIWDRMFPPDNRSLPGEDNH